MEQIVIAGDDRGDGPCFWCTRKHNSAVCPAETRKLESLAKGLQEFLLAAKAVTEGKGSAEEQADAKRVITRYVITRIGNLDA